MATERKKDRSGFLLGGAGVAVVASVLARAPRPA